MSGWSLLVHHAATDRTQHNTPDPPGSDAWSREAARVRIVAAQAGQPLAEDEIQLLDVYDLRALRHELDRTTRRQGTLRARRGVLPAIVGAMLGGLVGVRYEEDSRL